MTPESVVVRYKNFTYFIIIISTTLTVQENNVVSVIIMVYFFSDVLGQHRTCSYCREIVFIKRMIRIKIGLY